MESMPYELDKPLILPEHLRGELQRVHGILLEEDEIKNIEGMIICVGDVVTHTLLKMGIKPKMAVVDYKTKRGEMVFEDVRSFGERVFRVENPAGTITPGLWDAVKKALISEKNVKIVVDGEEDLAVIPVVFFAPLGANVIYGMPNTGLVLLKITPEERDKVKDLIKKMEV
ncbi:hypothetical protein AciM339_0483 [Aciduliprofundum sp. MAR08-339]|uniref:GTP-dependent dephospho-CoA kinase family protein n=1 Tax=Aciduliprofundum sp. (strain MAR08-339) TaxID=673860 RepID=UPI0002A48285|nr:hypothetical protein AciM339_0483 [Aciduliprofundum sp. MAR08-339]